MLQRYVRANILDATYIWGDGALLQDKQRIIKVCSPSTLSVQTPMSRRTRCAVCTLDSGKAPCPAPPHVHTLFLHCSHGVVRPCLQSARGKRVADSVEALLGATFLASGGGKALGCKGTSPAEQQQQGNVLVRTASMWDTAYLTRALAGTALLRCAALATLVTQEMQWFRSRRLH